MAGSMPMTRKSLYDIIILSILLLKITNSKRPNHNPKRSVLIMIKCTYCGVSVKGNAAAFCPKFKKPLKKKPRRKHPAQNKTKSQPQTTGKQSDRKQPLAKPISKKRTTLENIKSWLYFLFKPKRKPKPDLEKTPVINPMDENYDGYYDDKPTDDNAQNKDGLDPELIKRIVFISGGALLIVIFAIILLLLL
jgi:hypothetical protein